MDQAIANASRVFMGDSLGFHIIFVLFGLTLPVLVSWFEFMGIWRRNPDYIGVAKFWSKIMALLVIAGVISGTIIALQMSLVWPGILKFGGGVIGLPFMFETYAFLIEAVFLALYMTTWNNGRVSQMVHWLFGLGIIFGSTLSAFAITSVNAWMNFPVGFTLVQGKFENVDVIKAMFSETSLTEFFHSMFGYYVAAALAIAGLYAFKIMRAKLRDRTSKAHRLDWDTIHKLMIFSAIMLAATIYTADLTGKYLARSEPAKLATIEMVDHTTSNAPFIFGGVKDDHGNVVGPYIKIPNALSILTAGSANGVVTGLNDIPKGEQPPAFIRALFNLKLTFIIALTLVMVAYFVLRYLRREWLSRKVWLVTFGLIGFLGIVIVEFGWMITEIGRQPWAVRGYVTTQQAVTKTHDITNFGYFFPAAFVVLMIVTILGIAKIAHDNNNVNARNK